MPQRSTGMAWHAAQAPAWVLDTCALQAGHQLSHNPEPRHPESLTTPGPASRCDRSRSG
jgi:hypothetical protein